MEKALQLFDRYYGFDPRHLPHKMDEDNQIVLINCPDGEIVISMDGKLDGGEYVDYDMYGELIVTAAKLRKECEELRRALVECQQAKN